MADFFYIGSGGVGWRGCAAVTVEYPFTHRFAVGAAAYDRFSAEKGRLEEVWIREVFFRRNQAVVYKDTFNAIYGEANLCSRPEAAGIAADFLSAKLARLGGGCPTAR